MEGIPPVSPDLDEDLMMLRVAKETNLPVTELAHVPARWIGAALTAMEWQRLEAEKANKRHRRSGGKPAANPRNRRG